MYRFVRSWVDAVLVQVPARPRDIAHAACLVMALVCLAGCSSTPRDQKLGGAGGSAAAFAGNAGVHNGVGGSGGSGPTSGIAGQALSDNAGAGGETAESAGMGGTAEIGGKRGSGGSAGKTASGGGAAGTPGSPSDGGEGGMGGASGAGGSDESNAFSLFVTETPAGSPAQTQWGGVLRFSVSNDGAPLVATSGIDKSEVADPDTIAFRQQSSELFIGNRHAGTAADGIDGSISRFIYDRVLGTLTPNGTITGNGLNDVGQIAFSPTTGEMFAANYYVSGTGVAISRFTFDSLGNATPNGTLGTGATQGLLISLDGKRLYATSGGRTDSTIRQYDLSGDSTLPAVTISAAPRLFFMAALKGTLYVPAVDANRVFRLTMDANNDLTLKDSIPADGPVSVTFSPDAQEMFTAGHQSSDLIDRFQYSQEADSWTKTTTFTSSSMGGIIAL